MSYRITYHPEPYMLAISRDHFSTVIIAVTMIVTVCLLVYQINSLNKHIILGKRIENYTLFKELFDTVDNAEHLLSDNKRDKPLTSYNYIFDHFVSSPYWFMGYDLRCVDMLDAHKQFVFWERVQTLKNRQTEAELIFSDARISKYYGAYVDFLKQAYEYGVVFNKMKAQGTAFDEPEYRRKLFVAFGRLMVIHNEIKDQPVLKNEMKVV